MSRATETTSPSQTRPDSFSRGRARSSAWAAGSRETAPNSPPVSRSRSGRLLRRRSSMTTNRLVGRFVGGGDEPERGRSRRRRRSGAGRGASRSSTRRSIPSPGVATATPRSTRSPPAAETSKGGVYFHFPTKEAIFRELVRRPRTGSPRRSSAPSPSRPTRSPEPTPPCARSSLTFAGHRTMARLLFVDAMGAGRVFNAETNALHDRFAGMIAGYLDEAVAAGRDPADRHRPHRRRLVRGAQRGRRPVAAGRRPGARSRRSTRRCAPSSCGASASTRRGSRHRPSSAHDRRRPNDAAPDGAGVRTAASVAGASERSSRRRPTRRTATAAHDHAPDRRARPDRALRGRPRAGPRGRALAPAAQPTGRSSGSGGRGRSSPTGPDRFTSRPTAWRAVLAAAIVAGRTSDHGEAGPTLLGGLGFSGRSPAPTIRGRRSGRVARPADVRRRQHEAGRPA